MTTETFYNNYFNPQEPWSFFALKDNYSNTIIVLYKNGKGELSKYVDSLNFLYKDVTEKKVEEKELINYLSETVSISLFNYNGFKDYIRATLMTNVIDLKNRKYDEMFNALFKRVNDMGGKIVTIGNETNEYYLVCSTMSDDDFYYVLYDFEKCKLIAENHMSRINVCASTKQQPYFLCSLVNAYFENFIEVPITKIFVNNTNKLNRRVNYYNQLLK